MKKLLFACLFFISVAANAQTLVLPRNGGTGISSYTIGDLLYASGTTALSKLAGVATGSALISGGVGAAPSWGIPVTATNATNVATVGVSDNATYYPVMVPAASDSNQSVKYDTSGFSYNPFNNRLTTGSYVAATSGVYGLSMTSTLAGGNTVSLYPFVPSVSNDGWAIEVGSTNVLYGSSGGGIFIPALTTAAGTPNSICQNNSTKEITVNAALTCTVSSRDYKAGIEPFTGNGLRMVAAMQPDTFFYRDRLDRPRIGLMAEDLAAIDPRLAEWTNEGKANSIDFPAMFGVMVKAIQELRAEVDQLKGLRQVADIGR